MYMGTFWNYVNQKLTLDQMRSAHPTAVAALDDITDSPENLAFAEDVLPSLGPSGAYSDEDEAEHDDDDDWESDIHPTITGETGLMFYDVDNDELYVWNAVAGDGNWTLWNY